MDDESSRGSLNALEEHTDPGPGADVVTLFPCRSRVWTSISVINGHTSGSHTHYPICYERRTDGKTDAGRSSCVMGLDSVVCPVIARIGGSENSLASGILNQPESIEQSQGRQLYKHQRVAKIGHS